MRNTAFFNKCRNDIKAVGFFLGNIISFKKPAIIPALKSNKANNKFKKRRDAFTPILFAY